MRAKITMNVKFKSKDAYFFKKVVFEVFFYIFSPMVGLKYYSTVTGLYEYCFDRKECLQTAEPTNQKVHVLKSNSTFR